MKIGRRRISLLLLLVSSIVYTEASVGRLPRALSPAKNLQAAGTLGEVVASAGGSTGAGVGSASGSGSGKHLGTEHAPVDGKDGMPHEGPFVETTAERTRKKTHGSGLDDDDSAYQKTYSDQYSDTNIPQSNDAVMDDRLRSNPVEGTRGVEGGISEKSREGKITDKKPDPPKDARPIPHSEVEHLKEADSSHGSEPKGAAVLEEDPKKILAAPTDLPEKPYDIPPPENPSSPKDTKLSSETGSKTLKSAEDESAVIRPMHSLILSFAMIIFSEIGDKTFLVAALMAMRHPRVVVFTAAFSALVTMTVLSAVLGHAVPTLIPKWLTNFAAAGLFLVFGVKMLLEARAMSPDEGVSEEMKEVEMELEEKEHQQQRRMSRRRSSISPYALEAGRLSIGSKKHTSNGRLPSPPESPASSRESSPARGVGPSISNALAGINNLCSLLLSPAWVQTFVMTFLGEWGDRSQIATIAMAAGQDYWWVTVGALGGHAICTAAAVLGGKAIAGKVSLKTVTMGGAIAFLVFGVLYLLEAVY
ncbi:hypothetical protein ABEF92_003575 [Exophiala dermatitidis]|uniref:Uncharacterized protein n=1 Tax=Exophiala dermatitidis (strain ATCC 34100 / CBS 525.76 / NIH/UT8656) TaxID=858893 RepID=H6C327_EXODN|nr:uncharacterized protein HMPREF1120_06060 [Exophiala dermatitidis NIH/UT8656]EHY58042.1 hypothetical protein HMPREF1120_06060 [Exophiala dermatitidis NIH/UT8656]